MSRALRLFQKSIWNRNNRDKINAAAKRYYAKHPGLREAQRAVRSAIKRGDLVRPIVCSKCDVLAKVVAHHRDYSRPLWVRWLCRSCHNFLRKKEV